MYISSSNDRTDKSVDLNFEENINYIVSINIKNEGIMFNNIVINMKYVKDIDGKNIKKKSIISSGKEIKIKGSMKKNYTIYFGCEMKSNTIINKFRGFFGEIIVLDIKNKNLNNIKFSELLLNLERNYNDIVSIIGENSNNIFINYNNDNPIFIHIKNKIKNLEEKDKDNPLYNSIKTIISTNCFKLVEYNDLNIKKYIRKNEISKINIEKEYIDFRIQSESLEDEKMISINTSSFNKYFHVFTNNLTIMEFIKYDGINFLSLLMEYYYQILSHLLNDIDSYEKKEIKEICEKINLKILKNISFFNVHVIKQISIL